jgi:hypothetical protein
MWKPILNACANTAITKGKGKAHPRTGHEGPEGSSGIALFLTSALDGGGWSEPRPGRFTAGKDPVPIVQEAGWTPGPVWTGAENFTLTGIRSPDRPVHSESLYRPRSQAHTVITSRRNCGCNSEALVFSLHCC